MKDFFSNGEPMLEGYPNAQMISVVYQELDKRLIEKLGVLGKPKGVYLLGYSAATHKDY